MKLEMKLKEVKSISRATIYRIVALLVEAGILTEHYFGKNAKYYEHIKKGSHHDHIICSDCGYIEEFENSQIEELQLSIVKKYDYALVDHTLNLYGKCLLLEKNGSCPKGKQEKQFNQENKASNKQKAL